MLSASLSSKLLANDSVQYLREWTSRVRTGGTTVVPHVSVGLCQLLALLLAFGSVQS